MERNLLRQQCSSPQDKEFFSEVLLVYRKRPPAGSSRRPAAASCTSCSTRSLLSVRTPVETAVPTPEELPSARSPPVAVRGQADLKYPL